MQGISAVPTACGWRQAYMASLESASVAGDIRMRLCLDPFSVFILPGRKSVEPGDDLDELLVIVVMWTRGMALPSMMA